MINGARPKSAPALAKFFAKFPEFSPMPDFLRLVGRRAFACRGTGFWNLVRECSGPAVPISRALATCWSRRDSGIVSETESTRTRHRHGEGRVFQSLCLCASVVHSFSDARKSVPHSGHRPLTLPVRL